MPSDRASLQALRDLIVDTDLTLATIPDLPKNRTAHCRENLMAIRRLTRLTNAFSKKFENLWAALCLHFAYYNFCRIHKTLRVTPAMESKLTDHVWEIKELLEA